ncbi:MAG: hypothetical protein ACE5Z5_07545 [Candidatus Bathyarchaeia archaeon]
MIAVDTDVLAIHHLFVWDRRRKTNELFLEATRAESRGTTVHNLLELAGLFAIAGQSHRVETLLEKYLRSRDLAVIFPKIETDWGERVSIVTDYIKRGLSYGDALVARVLEEAVVGTFVTWNKKHFNGKVKARVLTPPEYLEENAPRAAP